MMTQTSKLSETKQEAYEKAVASLARYKFMMFGYWAAIWCYLNQMDDHVDPNPFRQLVVKAREMQQGSQKGRR